MRSPSVRDNRSAEIRLRLSNFLPVLAVLVCGCGSADTESTPAATITHPVSEAALTTVRLTAQAEHRLGIEVAPVERRMVVTRRSVGGEVVLPPGHSVSITAPRAGTLLAPAGGRMPGPGAHVVPGQVLVRLVAMLPEGDLLRVREDVTVAESSRDFAARRAERIAALYNNGIETLEAHERAQSDLQNADAVLRSNQARLALLAGETTADVHELSPVAVTAPARGVVRSVAAAQGQAVAAGAVLFEIARLDPVWIRVPVYVGDAAAIDRTAAGIVNAGREGGAGREANPVAAPPSADAQAASVDLFFTLRNQDESLRPGERVTVSLAMAAADSSLVVPWSAVIHDIHGGAWVYERIGELTYARRRVEVLHVSEGFAVLNRGPEPGTPVVTAGTPELFGTEFGPGR